MAAHSSGAALGDEVSSPRSGLGDRSPAAMVKLFRALLSRSDEVYGAFAPDGTTLYMSPSVKRLLGYSPEELVGRVQPLDDVAHPDDLARVRAYATRKRPARATWEAISYRRRRKDGSYVDVEATASCDGENLYGIMRDVSEQHVADAALRDLLLSTSFDLRINAQNVQAASALLLLHDAVRGDPEAAFLAGAIQSSCNLLLGIVTNVIEMRKLEEGELTLTAQTFSVADTLRDLLQVCAMGLQQGAAGLRWVNEEDAAAALPPLIEADLSHTSQIVQNLLTNAIKFSRGSEVRVTALMEPGDVLRVDVADCGEGLSPEDCERVFKPFERAAPDKGGGAGLGLHISRAFARAMGGDVTVQSEPGIGSTFTLRLPVRVVAPLSDAARATPPTSHTAAAAAAPLLPIAECHALPIAGDAAAATEAEPPTPCGVGKPYQVARTFTESGGSGAAAPTPPPSPEETDALTIRLLEELLANADEMFTCLSMSGSAATFQYVSPSNTRVLGYEAGSLVGRSVLDILHPDDQERVCSMLAAVLDGSVPYAQVMHRCRHADGTYRWLHAQVYLEQGLILCVARDATRAKNAEAALRQYLLSTSHDLRTPCHGILTAAQLLAARDAVAADAEAAFLVQAVRSGCNLMLTVISNILEMRFMDSATSADADESAKKAAEMRLNLKPVSCAPRELVASVLQTCRVGCGLLRGRLQWITEDDAMALPPRVYADVDRVAQILQSVVVYSLQHSPGDAPLTVAARCVSLDAGAAGGSADAADAEHARAELRIEVCDPARKLWTEECARIFSPNFIRSKATDVGGTCSGLGLFVARAAARAMGGDVHAECVGTCGGSTLHVRLPVGLPGTADAGVPEALAGASPSAAHLAAASAAYAAGASSPRGAKRPPAAGAPEPPPAPEPQRARGEHAATPVEPPTAAPPSRPRCLLVDDHVLNIKLVTRLLERHGFEVTTATNGLEALQALQASSLGGAPGAPPAPDLALVDLQMPVMGGLEFARRFREWERATQPEGQRLVIVALSANVLDSHVTECTDAGMDGHLGKPLRADSLEQLRRYISCAAPRADEPGG